MENLLIKVGTLLLCVFTVTVGSCSINKQNKLADMVKAGQDPQKAACAVYFGEFQNEMIICNAIANKE